MARIIRMILHSYIHFSLFCFVVARSILAEFSVIVLRDSNSNFGVPRADLIARGHDEFRARA